MSRHKLTLSDVVDYKGDSLFCQFAQVVCELDGIVPRKELHESWEAAVLIHSAFPQTSRVADLASGNGLLSWALMVLDPSESRRCVAVCVAVGAAVGVAVCVAVFVGSVSCHGRSWFSTPWSHAGVLQCVLQ